MAIADMPQQTAEFFLSAAAAHLAVPELMVRTAALLAEDGVSVHRMSWSVPTLHPQVRLSQHVWVEGEAVQSKSRLHSGVTTTGYRASPFRALADGQRSIRHRIAPGAGPREYPVLDELAEAGFSDYVAMMQPARTEYEHAPITYATRVVGGFTDAQLAKLTGLLPLLTLVLAQAAQRERVRHLLETYVGGDAATRVLDGHIQRGDLVEVEAAVCFCDLRDFTSLSQRLSHPDLLRLLDDAFEVVVEAVHANDGDVLKFIGDAVLAVFRRRDTEPDLAAAASRAVRAAAAVVSRADEVHQRRVAQGLAPLRLGLAVHVGDVLYGNIGSATRLDFTVIGGTVNIASRLEGLCKQLQAPIVVSGAVAELLAGGDVPVSLDDGGRHALRGVAEPMQVYRAFPR
jgi:adenylate cyclase